MNVKHGKYLNQTVKQNEHISRNPCLKQKHECMNQKEKQNTIQSKQRKSPNAKVQEARSPVYQAQCRGTTALHPARVSL